MIDIVKTDISFGRILKTNLSWSPNSSEILPVNCKFIRCSPST